MRKSILSLSLLFAILAGLQTQAQAQYEDVIKYQLNEALKINLNNVSPPKGCECNDCNFVYGSSMKIERTKKYQGKLLVWGKAKTQYKSKFSGGGVKVVDYYAEIQKSGSDFVVTKLMWKANSCMKLESLMN